MIISGVIFNCCLLQFPEDYTRLRKERWVRIMWGTELRGLCYHNLRLYVVKRSGCLEHSLFVYRVNEEELQLLDTVALVGDYGCPRVDGYTQQVYIPCRWKKSVSVVSWDDSGLMLQPKLTCVGRCHSVGVMSPKTICACDQIRGSVSVVNVTDDTVIAALMKPNEVRDKIPHATAVLGNTILVLYGDNKLVVYENGVSSSGTMVTWPAGLQDVRSMSSDGASKFLVCDRSSKAVWTLNVSGKLCDKIKIGSGVLDCTVGDGKLWVGCDNGDILVMSPQ